MATTTPNFGWSVPTSTDLVKDGATAIETLGDSVDASMGDLLGGTSGQMLVKNSNTNMDFIWQTPNVGDITEVQAGTGISVASGTGPIPVITNTATTTIDAEGDLLVGDAADALQRLAIGSNTHVLTVDTSVDGKIKWAAPAAGGGFTLIQDQQASASSAINFTSIAGTYKHLLLTWEGLGSTTDSSTAFSVRYNSDSGSNYVNRAISFIGTTATASASADTSVGFGKFIGQGFQGAGTTDRSRGYLWVYNYASTTRFKSCVGSSSYNDQGLGEYYLPTLLTTYISTSAITDLNIVRLAGTGNITNNANTSIRLYGVS